MQLASLVADLPNILAVTGHSDASVSSIASDSRQVAQRTLFVAYRGVGVDGHRYIHDAIARGASAVVGENPDPGLPVPYVQVDDGRAALAWLMAAWYGHPSRAMALVGITGTDGKTTTANLLFSILRAAGLRAGLISTVNAVIGDRDYDTGLHTTTPDAPDVQRYLAQMRDAATEVAVLETTSHGLAQHRVTGCEFDLAVVTNITHEHLDFHGTYEAYREAKALLFRALAASPHKLRRWAAHTGGLLPKTAILNRDDASYEFLAAIPVERTITYGLIPPRTGGPRTMGGGVDTQGAVHLTATNLRNSPDGVEFDVSGGSAASAPLGLVSPLVGAFNVSNILAATAAALALGMEPAAIRVGVAAVAGVPGRMQRIDRGQDFAAIVDFAHTPNALARALETVRGLADPNGRVIVVFGCAGLRDREKRRLMGEIAAAKADLVVITAEDPRTEDLAAIMSETASACAAAKPKRAHAVAQISDRQGAILHAVRHAHSGDVVIVCGKGHEQSMCFGETEHPWRDQDALAWALDGLRGQADDSPPFLLPTWTGC